jgi:hypothetical protein
MTGRRNTLAFALATALALLSVAVALPANVFKEKLADGLDTALAVRAVPGSKTVFLIVQRGGTVLLGDTAKGTPMQFETFMQITNVNTGEWLEGWVEASSS